jgi:hypothetical protein
MKSKLLEKLIKDKIEFYVKVSNDDERDKLLSLYDNYDDIRWVGSGCRPIEFSYLHYPYYIYLNINKKISWSNDCSSKIIEIKLDDLLNSLFKQEIHITRKNQEVHAILKENGKVIKRTIAKCHPEDEFDFKMGSKLAYDRLFEKDNKDGQAKNVEANKSKHKFKVGDKVRIRQWDDMAEEFGVNYGFINVGTNIFTYAMKYLCGKIAIIKATGANNLVRLEFKGNVDDTDYWVYTTDMIEPYTPRVAKAGEYVKVIEGEDSGKIFKCTKNFWQTGGYFENFEYCYSDIVLFPSEYEVLDDYIPPLNCRFIALEGSEYLTKGKIYEVKNGRFADDSGSYFPLGITLKDENDLKKYFSSKQERGIQTGYCYNEIKYIIVKE